MVVFVSGGVDGVRCMDLRACGCGCGCLRVFVSTCDCVFFSTIQFSFFLRHLIPFVLS